MGAIYHVFTTIIAHWVEKEQYNHSTIKFNSEKRNSLQSRLRVFSGFNFI